MWNIFIGLILFGRANGVETLTFLESSANGYQCPNYIHAFDVSSDIASSWPPASLSTINFVLTGVFNQDQNINTINVQINSSGFLISVTNTQVWGSFKAGQTGTFPYSVKFPVLLSGSYSIITKIINSSGKAINCWEIDFGNGDN